MRSFVRHRGIAVLGIVGLVGGLAAVSVAGPSPTAMANWHGPTSRRSRQGRQIGSSSTPRHATEAASTKDTTGLKCAPLTGPSIKMIAKGLSAVAAAFSVSWKPTSFGDDC